MSEPRSDWRRRWHIPERGTGPALMISLLAHGLLLLAIAFAVRWNTRPVGPVSVELWGAPPPPVVSEPTRPTPPPPPPRPVEPEPERKADIVVEPKKVPPKPEPKKVEPDPEIEAKKLAAAKAAEVKRLEEQRKLAEEKAAEAKRQAAKAAEAKRQAEVKAAQEKEAEERRQQTLKRLAAAAGSSSSPAAGGISAGYEAQIVGCVRPHIVFNVPEGVRPKQYVAEFEVQLLPTGEQAGAPKLLKSSGLAAYDQAVERAIRRCDPFPRPREGAMPRSIRLFFDPVETR